MEPREPAHDSRNEEQGPGVAFPSNSATLTPPDSPADSDAHPADEQPPDNILTVDIGGSKVKLLATGQTEPRKAATGVRFTPSVLVEVVEELTNDWEYDAISIGYPGLVGDSGPRSEPGNLGPGWVGFDFTAAFGRPVRIVNDAAMQALGSYEGGRMLFLGLGTGIGSALIVENVLITLELGQVPFGDQKLVDVLGRRGLERLGKKSWRAAVARIVPCLMGSFLADYVVLGGGNSKQIKELPSGSRLGHNLTAFRGGFRLWHVDDVKTLGKNGRLPRPPVGAFDWRFI